MNTADLKTSFEFEGKCTPAKDEFEAKLVAQVGGFKLGPVLPDCEVSNIFL